MLALHLSHYCHHKCRRMVPIVVGVINPWQPQNHVLVSSMWEGFWAWLVKVLVFPSPTSLHVVIFWFFTTNSRLIPHIPLKRSIVFLKQWTSTIHSSNSTGSSGTTLFLSNNVGLPFGMTCSHNFLLALSSFLPTKLFHILRYAYYLLMLFRGGRDDTLGKMS